MAAELSCRLKYGCLSCGNLAARLMVAAVGACLYVVAFFKTYLFFPIYATVKSSGKKHFQIVFASLSLSTSVPVGCMMIFFFK